MSSRIILHAFAFYAITMILALGAAVAAPRLGEASLLLTMLTPAAAVVLMLVVIAPQGRLRDALAALGLTRLGLKGWPFAVGGPAAIHFATFVVLSVTGLAVFTAPHPSKPLAIVLVQMTIGLGISTLLALAEEVGWRGYMLPRLIGLGAVPAMLLVGFLHGLWHLPLMLSTDLYHSAGNPLLVAPLFLATLTLAGLFYGFLRLWTGSVWPVAVAHAAANNAWNLMSEMTETKSVLALEYVGGESGLVMITGLLITSGVLVWLMRHKRVAMAIAT